MGTSPSVEPIAVIAPVCLAGRVRQYSRTEAGHANKLARFQRWMAKPGNIEKYRASNRKSSTRPEAKERAKNSVKRKYHSDQQFRQAKVIRNLTYAVLVGRNRNPSTALALFGCTRDEARAHIQDQFGPGMSWENYGQWQIDHKRPLSAFDLRNPEERAAASHFTNLQPLWAFENQSKGSRLH
jgi:hypothetical protein